MPPLRHSAQLQWVVIPLFLLFAFWKRHMHAAAANEPRTGNYCTSTDTFLGNVLVNRLHHAGQDHGVPQAHHALTLINIYTCCTSSCMFLLVARRA